MGRGTGFMPKFLYIGIGWFLDGELGFGFGRLGRSRVFVGCSNKVNK